MKWTKEQSQAIFEKDSNILVAAAAGSGKTAVLVERIINKVVNEGIDIDKILVVTFTNAAASEMRERILDAIYEKLEKNPEDTNLQRQITLLNKASICTIHSFCLDVIRNNFYEIDTSANFRIGDTAEVELLKTDVIQEVFEQKYLEEDKGFLKLIDTYTGYRGDEALVELILNIYKYIQSSPFPEKWLEEKVEMFNVREDIDFSETIWGQIILQETKNIIQECIIKLNKIKKDTLKFVELDKYSETLRQDVNELTYIYENSDTWDKAYENILNLNRSWKKWPIDRKVTMDLKNEAKDIRNKVKKQFEAIDITYNSKEAIQDIRDMYDILKEIQKLVMELSRAFAEKKREKNIIDFNDIEHFALKILLKQTENGVEPTEVAKKYREKFAELAIDEYQDSNLVQEYILNSISNGKNIFMVGDVKQSIYKFRQARPELFLEKYATYNLKENFKEESGLKIQLFKNFRSRENVLDITNLIFENIMSSNLGDVDYTEEEYLNYGANYPNPEEANAKFAGIAELNIIDLKDDTELDIYKDKEDSQIENTNIEKNELKASIEKIANKAKNENTFEIKNAEAEGIEEQDDEERIENSVLEARFVAKKIQELLNSDYIVFDKKNKDYRKITYKDICVLLRSTTTNAPIYEKEISELDLPVFSDTSTTYLDSMEVQIIMALLKIIDNPMQDIPLVTVLRSSIGNFDDNELIQIRLADKNSSFYEAMLKARLIVKDELKEKIERLLEGIEKWKKEEQYLPLDEFIWKLYLDTGFYHYVSLLTNGGLRQANLKLLFEKAKQYERASFKGLFNFINFIDKVKTSSGDMGSAKLIGENENVIRIMSIHKSKGLEFPVVFLCGTGKKFNLQDLNGPVLLHQDIGFGPKLIDSERKIEYNTLAKEAIRIKSKKETISEEMRVLYVALTRAREKLFITGISKDLHKALNEKEQMLSMYLASNIQENDEVNSKENIEKSVDKINSQLVEKYTSYLDWIELVYLYNKDKIADIMELKEYKKSTILAELQKTEKEEINIEKIIEENNKKNENSEERETIRKEINELLGWKYPYIESSKIPTKTSVTKLKQAEENNNVAQVYDIEDLMEVAIAKEKKEEHQSKLTYIPKFIEQQQKLTPAQKGTLMHLCIQKLDESQEYTSEDIEKFVQELYEKSIISKTEKESVNTKVLYEYTKSELWQELKQAKKVKKEEPFYINIPAKTIYENAEKNENILVQGIIDLYYIDKNDKLILVDFKTDYVKKGEEYKLEEKYKVQLDLYKEALEEALGRKVDKAMIYALS